MRLTVVGCSPAWPNPGGAQSGYLVEGSGRLLLDCGPGVLPRLREQDGWPRVDAIVITHFHLDHWGDLVPWTFGAMYGPGRDAPQPELWLPPNGLAELEVFGEKFGVPGMFGEAFDTREYEDGVPFETCGLEVTPLSVPHYQLQTYALRVSDGTSTLAYSGDSAPSPQLASVGRDADLFLCEATLARGDLDGEPRGHLSLDEALDAHARAGARRLVVTHRPAELPGRDGVESASDGMVCEV